MDVSGSSGCMLLCECQPAACKAPNLLLDGKRLLGWQKCFTYTATTASLVSDVSGQDQRLQRTEITCQTHSPAQPTAAEEMNRRATVLVW